MPLDARHTKRHSRFFSFLVFFWCKLQAVLCTLLLQSVVDAAQVGELRSRCARQEAEAAAMTDQISTQKAVIAEGNENLESQAKRTE